MMDKIDELIISELMKNSRDSFRRIAQRLKLHPTTVISRVEKLEKSGIIVGYGANLDHSKLGYEFKGIIQIKIHKGDLIGTQEKIGKLPGVVAVYDVTGEYDAVAIIAAKSREYFSKLIKKILQMPNVEHTNTQVVLKVVKKPWEFEGV